MDIQIRIDNDTLSVKGAANIVSGSKNYYRLEGVFTPDWSELDKYVVFPSAECSVKVDDENHAYLPEALVTQKGVLRFGLIGLDSDETLRISTNYVQLRVLEGASEASADPPSPDESSTWEGYLGELADECVAKVKNAMTGVGNYTWYIDTDVVKDKDGTSKGKLSACMTDDYIGTWFYVRTTSSESGSAAYPSTYEIDGANGYLSLRDYVIWTGKRLVHVSTYEAKASTTKNSDGKYSPKSGVDGLMSSTDKAYLTDLINEYWGKTTLPVFSEPNTDTGWQVNWCRDTGWYLGGLQADCGGHPPVLNDNQTSWAVLTLNGMATDASSLNKNHRLQIAYDLVNSKVYMRRGWMSTNTWADKWSEVGGTLADGSVTMDNLDSTLQALVERTVFVKGGEFAAAGNIPVVSSGHEVVDSGVSIDDVNTALSISHTHANITALNQVTGTKIDLWDYGMKYYGRLTDIFDRKSFLKGAVYMAISSTGSASGTMYIAKKASTATCTIVDSDGADWLKSLYGVDNEDDATEITATDDQKTALLAEYFHTVTFADSSLADKVTALETRVAALEAAAQA